MYQLFYVTWGNFKDGNRGTIATADTIANALDLARAWHSTPGRPTHTEDGHGLKGVGIALPGQAWVSFVLPFYGGPYAEIFGPWPIRVGLPERGRPGEVQIEETGAGGPEILENRGQVDGYIEALRLAASIAFPEPS